MDLERDSKTGLPNPDWNLLSASPATGDAEPGSTRPADFRADAPRPIVKQNLSSPRRAEYLFSRLFWLTTFALFVLLIWRVGPLVLENYHYSIVKGTIRAEYDAAFQLMEGDPLQGLSKAYQLVALKTRPSVVSIKAVHRNRDVDTGQGSGVIMSVDGFVLTNEHVVRDAELIEVTLCDRRVYQATVVGIADKYNDLAVLKIQADNLIPAEWGDSDQMQVGSIVWAVGSPFGLAQSVTSGIISAKNRFDPRAPNLELLQTDAAVNPGNSGGPLVDSMGRVIGINTSIHGPEYRGISFAVPSVQAKFVYEQILERGYVSRGMLGAYPGPVYQIDAKRFGLPDIDGALLKAIEPDSPAMRSGLRVNDVVRSWDGNPIDDFNKLFRYVSMTSPASVAQVDIIRDGRLHSLQVQVGSLSDAFENNHAR